MTSSSSLYGTITQQNTSSTNSTGLYGGADTPIPDSSGNVVVRGDLYVLSGNILTTATTGNIFPTNATTVNIANSATSVNIGANTGNTNIDNNLYVDGTGNFTGDITATGADFGNITIAVADDQTITTTVGELRLSSASGNIRLPSVTSINTDTTGSFGVLNQPTTVNAFLAATALNLGATTGTTNVNNNLLVEGTGTFTGDIDATGADLGNITVGITNNNTIDTTTGDLNLSSTNGVIGMLGVGTLYSDQSSFLLLNAPTTITAFDSATSLTLADVTGTTFIRNDVSVGGDLKVNGNDIKSNGGTTAITLSGANVTVAGDLTVNGTIINGGGQFGNIQIGVTNDNTIDTTTGDLKLDSATGQIGLVGAGTLYTDQSTFLLLNSPTTVTAFDSATTLNLGDVTGTTFIRNDVSVGGNLKVNGNTIKSNGGTTAITLNGADVGVSGDLTVFGGDLTVAGNGYIYSATGLALDLTGADTRVVNDLTVSGDNINLAQSTLISYSENNDRANRPEVQSTTGNSSGWRVIAPNATTSANSNLTVFGSNDINNGQFLSVQASGSTTAPFNIRTGTYTAGVLSASGDVISFVDGTTTYATLNPAGPTNSTDLATKSYVDSQELNTTYTIDASSTTGGANFNLVGSDSTTDTIKFSGSGATTVTQTSANEITISSTDNNTTYTQDVSSTTGGANLNLVGSDSTTDSVKFAGGTNVSVVATDASTVTINATDTNTTYDFNASSTTGGANLNLVGSDSTTDTVKLSNGTGVTVSQVSGTEVSVAIGQAVGTSDNVQFASVRTPTINANGGVSFVNTSVGGGTYATVNSFGPANPTDLITKSYLESNAVTSLAAGTYLSVNSSTGAVTISTNATSANTASTIVARDSSGNFSAGTITANLANMSYVLGDLQATTNSSYSFPSLALTSVSSNNGLDAASSMPAGSSLGAGGQQQITHYFGDTFAGTNTTAAFAFRTAAGNSVTGGTVPFTGASQTAASAIQSASALGTVNFNGYATTGFSDIIATRNQGGGFTALHAGQIQYYAAEAFADGTTTISGATITAVSRVNVAQTVTNVSGTRGQLTIPSTLAGVGTAVIVTGTLTGTATGISAGTYYIVANNGGAGNSTSITLGTTPGGAPITTTAGTVTGLTFTRQLITVTYSTQTTIPYGTNALIAVSGFNNVTAGTYMVVGAPTTTSVTIGAVSTGAVSLSGTQSLSLTSVTNAGTGFRVRGFPLATTVNNLNRVDFIDHRAAAATYRSDAFTWAAGGYGNTGATMATLDSSGNLAITGDLRVNGNDIQNSGGSSAITLTSANTATTVRGDTINLQTAASVGITSDKISYNRVYGQWQYDATVTPAASNTAYAFPIAGASGVTDFANIASVGSTSRIIPGAAGMYKLQFSVQIQNDDSASEHIAYFWWRKNGTDVPGSMGQVGIVKATGTDNGLTIAGWDNMIQSANTTDYWELMYAVDDATHVDFPAFSSTAFGPSTAALFITLVPVGA